MAKNIIVHTIDAFAKEGEETTGNPAGFVLSEQLSEQEMAYIAAEVGFSETAFVTDCRNLQANSNETNDNNNQSVNSPDFKVQFFTPNEEVDLCGHATIGLFSGMYQLGLISTGEWRQETKAGILRVRIQEDGSVLMEQAAPQMTEIVPAQKIASSLGLEAEDIHFELPCQIVSTGLRDLLIPVKSVKALEHIQPDDEAISAISKELNITGYHVFTLTGDESARCRNFAPLYAIPEEAATGTSNGALTAYLIHYLKQAKSFTFIQGVEMGNPSEINGYMDQTGCIWVGGKASHLGEKVVSL